MRHRAGPDFLLDNPLPKVAPGNVSPHVSIQSQASGIESGQRMAPLRNPVMGLNLCGDAACFVFFFSFFKEQAAETSHARFGHDSRSHGSDNCCDTDAGLDAWPTCNSDDSWQGTGKLCVRGF